MTTRSQQGMSLVEVMIVLVILLIVLGSIFGLVNLATARAASEQAKLDIFQEAREFMDQMSRDLRQAGYPSPRNYASGVLSTPADEDQRVAAGLVRVATDELWFEGDIDGTGTASVVHYWLDPSTTNNCPCLKRSQLPKVAGNPLTAQSAPVYQTEVQNVISSNIFSAFLKGATGSSLTLPIDFNSNSVTVAEVDTIQAVLTVQSAMVDAQTRTRPMATLAITVKLNNCSMAANGETMSCD